MNVLTIFDQRINAIFEEGSPGVQPPFSFRRLAKRAVREMEDETFVIDGVDTAPALYTVLVSQLDDSLMRHMYVRITDEISQLVEAQAKKRGYTFVGRPLVRFMVDPALRSGRFSLFAENVDPRTLARLRDEENAYLGITPPQEIIVDHGFMPESVPMAEEEPAPVAQESLFAGEISQEEVVAIDEEYVSEEPQIVEAEKSFDNMDAILNDEDMAHEELANDDFEVDEPQILQQDSEPAPSDDLYSDDLMGKSISVAEAAAILAADAAEEELPNEEDNFEPVTDEAKKAKTDFEDDFLFSSADHVEVPDFIQTPPAKHRAKPSCTLTDKATGKTYTVTAERTPIGREHIPGGVVLHDPNVSRRHSEIVYDGMDWHIRDLNSTNGTIVNNEEVPETILHTGDILTLGVTELEFKAN
ncbi:MAG: DUF3662 and FHA domain-containing protein [Coriobacteriales bacterium]|nr:DUF3662 and FHA domain-containing protein [Coriobacteriales bacterium]